MRKSALFLAVISIYIFILPAFGKTIFTCEGPSGYAYYVEGGIVPKGKGGWVTDQISKGKISLISNDEDIDVLFLDATGSLQSSKDSGALISYVGASESMISVMVLYPSQLVEVYTYDFENKALYWMQQKYGAPVNKLGAYVAKKCQH